MVTIITEISKYIIIVLMLLYTFSCFRVLKTSEADKKNPILNRQIVYVFFVHFLSFLTLYLRLKDTKILIFYGVQIVVAALYMTIYHMYYKESSRLITNNMCFLLLIGYTMLTRIDYSMNTKLALKQFLIATVSLVFVSFIPLIMIKIKTLRNFTYFYGIGGVLLLSSVFVIGVEKYGAYNWIGFAGMSLQPSEFAKIIYIFFIGSMMAKSKELKQILITSAFAAAHMCVLVLEKDLGGAAIFFMIFLMMIYVATNKARYFFGILVGGIGCAGIAFLIFRNKLFNHVYTRIIAWINPWSDIEVKGWQIAQSLFAIGTGGWTGAGLGKGSPTLIPVRESDFIFAAIAEEFGTLFALALILLCLSCFIGFVIITMRTKNAFYKNLGVGFSVCYIFQVFLTIGGVTKFIPSTGVTLPLVSYGGSSLLGTLIIFSIMQGIFIISNKEGNKLERERKPVKEEKNDEKQLNKE